MTAPKRPRLGRGLDALLGDSLGPPPSSGADGRETLREIPIEQLSRGKYQPRTHMDKEALEDLAASIRAQGIVQPIVVRETGPARFEIIAGERRWRAAQLAGLLHVPAVVRNIPDEAAIAVALIENIQREDLNPIEEAMALKRLSEEFRLTHQETAEAVGRSRAAVTNLLRLLSLVPEARALLEESRIDMGHARALLSLPEHQQAEAARQVVDRGLSVRETEELARRLLAQGKEKARVAAPLSGNADVRSLQENLSERLGARVLIQHQAKGKGRLMIDYNSLDELEGILERIR